MSTVLITGAGRGLGATATRRLAEQGWTVLAGCRDPSAAAERNGWPSSGLDVRPIPLDVCDDRSVAAAADAVADAHDALDAVVNNAGVAGSGVAAPDVQVQHMREVFETNVLGPVRVTRAFLPLLRRAAHPRLVLVSSGVGSQNHMTGGAWYAGLDHVPYPASKAALNMVGTQYAKALPDVLVTVVDPGFTATDLNGHRGTQTVQEGTDAIVEAVLGVDGPSGLFRGRDGLVPW